MLVFPLQVHIRPSKKVLKKKVLTNISPFPAYTYIQELTVVSFFFFSFMTLITILTIENLNSWRSLWPDNQEWNWTAFTTFPMFRSPSIPYINWTQQKTKKSQMHHRKVSAQYAASSDPFWNQVNDELIKSLLSQRARPHRPQASESETHLKCYRFLIRDVTTERL